MFNSLFFNEKADFKLLTYTTDVNKPQVIPYSFFFCLCVLIYKSEEKYFHFQSVFEVKDFGQILSKV